MNHERHEKHEQGTTAKKGYQKGAVRLTQKASYHIPAIDFLLSVSRKCRDGARRARKTAPLRPGRDLGPTNGNPARVLTMAWWHHGHLQLRDLRHFLRFLILHANADSFQPGVTTPDVPSQLALKVFLASTHRQLMHLRSPVRLLARHANADAFQPGVTTFNVPSQLALKVFWLYPPTAHALATPCASPYTSRECERLTARSYAPPSAFANPLSRWPISPPEAFSPFPFLFPSFLPFFPSALNALPCATLRSRLRG